MAESEASSNELFELLNAISRINLDDDDAPYVHSDNNNKIVSRGKPPSNGFRKTELQNRLITKKRKKTLNDKIDALKEIVQKKDDENGLMLLASYINEILEPWQKNAFIAEFNGHSNGNSEFEISYSEYIPSVSQNNVTMPYIRPSKIVARSGEPQNSINEGDVLDSIQDENSLKIPLERHYNTSELYIIHKGIYFSRVSLARSNSSNDYSIIRELESKNLLDVVLTERINGDNNYIMTLVENYPKSLEEIKSLLCRENALILKSSIFVYMAQKSVQHLYEFLVQLSKIINKNDLSRACDNSMLSGVNVSTLLEQNLSPELRVYADKISKFLHRYK